MQTEEEIISQTKEWIERVVIGLNFCPFAAKPVKEKLVRYKVEENTTINTALQTLIRECIRLEEEVSIETSFIIFPNHFNDFETYLDLVDLAEQLMEKEGYEGVFQVASFHPLYMFADSEESDPANYTNRSPYPMLHLLREEKLEAALKKYPNPEAIPERNIITARKLGLEYFKTKKIE